MLCVLPVQAGSAEDLLAGVQQWLDGTVDLQGAFEQELVSGALGSGLEESGRFFVHRPGQLRFDYLEPEHKVAVVNGSATLFWIEEDEQTVRGTLDTADDLLFGLLAGGRPLEQLFEPSIDVEPVRRGRVRLRLLPIHEEETFTELILTLRRSTHALEAIELLDPAGNRSLYRFSGVRRNAGLPAGLFRFEPPDGS